MELRDIEYFAAVAKDGHLGRAAEALGLSQSALSKSLRRLEEEMAAKLVKRTPKGVELTAEGSTLLDCAHRLRLSLDDIKQQVTDVRKGLAGQLRIGAAVGFSFHFLPMACNVFLRSAPGATLKIREIGYGDALAALRKGDFDLGVQVIQASAPHDMMQQRLYDDHYVVIASANHKFASQRPIALADVSRERWILQEPTFAIAEYLRGVFEKQGLAPPGVAIETSSTTLRLPVVAQSDLLGYSWGSIVRQVARDLRLAELDVPELASTFTVGVIYRKDAYLSSVASRFIEALKAAAATMSERDR